MATVEELEARLNHLTAARLAQQLGFSYHRWQG
jgi:hypothetical protein